MVLARQRDGDRQRQKNWESKLIWTYYLTIAEVYSAISPEITITLNFGNIFSSRFVNHQAHFMSISL